MERLKNTWRWLQRTFTKYLSTFCRMRVEMGNKGNPSMPRLNVKLRNFKFYHTASTPERIDEKYIQRTKLAQKLKAWLNEKSGHGVYLITGHRGTGKSSLVGSVTNELKKQRGQGLRMRRQLLDICVSIGQDNINELHILHIVAKQMREKIFCKNRLRYRWFFYVEKNKWLLRGILVAVFSFDYVLLRNSFSGFFVLYYFINPMTISEWGFFSNIHILNVLIFISVLLILLFNRFYRIFHGRHSGFRIMKRLDKLCSRFYAEYSAETSTDVGKKVGLLYGHRRTYTMPPVSMQEIETELIGILNDFNKCDRVIIVFDELDKVDPQGDEYKVQGGEPLIVPEARRRKVLNMIANMKYFLSTARAYFVFIAGPELYDAAMADISDREFAIGNLFNGVLSVDSFYTKGELSDAIALTEEFVCRRIMKPARNHRIDKNREYTLKQYWHSHKDYHCKKAEIVFLYHFICYLAFISHGSPKKIAMFFEKYVRDYKYLKDNKQDFGINKSTRKNVKFLTFSDHQQMKINFVHYLTFPILQNIMNRSAIFGDKLRVAESFIFAHIVKLHNGGFSWRNIEQIPEIMAINRAPEVREYIQAILLNMTQSRLTSIVCGLYAYKFPLRLAEEISYFSKLSDELSALLNFAIGELQPVKEHYIALLNKLPTMINRESQQCVRWNGGHIYAEASVRHALGDIYMQEENFSAAILQFERCVELVTPLLLSHKINKNSQLQNYVLFCYRTMLKLGLAHEKRHTYNSAYVVYGDLWGVLFAAKEGFADAILPLCRDNRGLHLGILAQLYVLECIGTTGITSGHIDDAINKFDELFKFENKSVCNPIVKADFYRKLGDLLYYKNFECSGKQDYSAVKMYIKGINALFDANEEMNIEMCMNKIYSEALSLGFLNNKEDKLRDVCLAILLESFGHAYLSNIQYDNIEPDLTSISHFRNLVMQEQKNQKNQGFPTNIPKWMIPFYCYWISAELNDMADEHRSERRCYEEIMHLLEIYMSLKIEKGKELMKAVLELSGYIRNKQYKIVYSQYEHINRLERRMQNIWFSADNKHDKELKKSQKKNMRCSCQYLSFNTDMEEIDYCYYRFVVAYCKCKSKHFCPSPFVPSVAKILLKKLDSNVAYKNATLTTMISNHRLVLQIYKYYLEGFFAADNTEKTDFDTPVSVSQDLVKKFMDEADCLHYANEYGDLRTFLRREASRKAVPPRNDKPCMNFKKCKHFKRCKNFKKLQNFKNCKECHACNNCRKYTEYKRYKFSLLNEILVDAIRRSDEIVKWMVGPLQITTLFNYTFQGNVYGNYGIFVRLYKQLEDYYREYGATLKIEFEPIDASSVMYADEDYLEARAWRSYVTVQECHRQGPAYQDMMHQLYFLEDDFNNETIQFYLATERVTLPATKGKEEQLRSFLFSKTVA